MKKEKETFITLNQNIIFHQEIQPIDAASLKKKSELFKKNLEKRVQENLKRINQKPE